MDILEWATSPWGQSVPIHIAWFLIWVAAIAGLLFLIVHAIYLRYFAKAKEFAGNVSPAVAARIPEHVPRHSLVARLFHWIMAASMFTLLFTAFLPKVGVQFRLGDLPLDRRSCPNSFDHLSHHSCFFLAGLLGDLAGQRRPAGCMETNTAVYGEERAPAATGSPSILWRTSSTTARSLRPVCLRSEPACS